MSQLPEPHIQGYIPVAFRTDMGGRCCDYHEDHGQRQTPQDALAPRGQYACPDCNYQKYDPQLVCEACKRRGHLAATCDMLAQALFLTKYMKNILTEQARAKMEEAWLQRWSAQLGCPTQTPGKVMRTYLEEMNMMMDDLNVQICLDCWPEGD
jgi:hypothetical protein